MMRRTYGFSWMKRQTKTEIVSCAQSRAKWEEAGNLQTQTTVLHPTHSLSFLLFKQNRRLQENGVDYYKCHRP